VLVVANAGFFTLVAARLVGPHGKCVAFDPSPDNHVSITEQIQLNTLSHCTPVKHAIGDYAGKSKFSFAAPGSAQAHLGESRNGEQEVEKVRPLRSGHSGRASRYCSACPVSRSRKSRRARFLSPKPSTRRYSK
jgi:FkbM family methyltransferase